MTPAAPPVTSPVVTLGPIKKRESRETLMQSVYERIHDGATSITLVIDSPGGHVHDAAKIYVELQRLPIPVFTHAVYVASAALWPFLAAPLERRSCDPAAGFVIHEGHHDITLAADGPSEHLTGWKASLTARQLRELLAGVEANDRHSARLLLQRCRFADAAELERVTLEGAVHPAGWALQKGLVSWIRQLAVTDR